MIRSALCLNFVTGGDNNSRTQEHDRNESNRQPLNEPHTLIRHRLVDLSFVTVVTRRLHHLRILARNVQESLDIHPFHGFFQAVIDVNSSTISFNRCSRLP